MNSSYSVRVLYHPFATFFTPHFAFLEKIINKEYPASPQDGGRQALDGCLPTLFKPHKDRDGVQGGRVSRGGGIIGDNLIIFASSVNFSIFTHFFVLLSPKLLKFGEIKDVKFLA